MLNDNRLLRALDADVVPTLDAVAGAVGDFLLIFNSVVGETCSDVVRLLFQMFDIPSETDCVGEGVVSSIGLLAYRSCLSIAPGASADDPDGVGGELTGCSDVRAVVAAALDVDAVAAPALGNGASRPPLNDIRDLELAREPGRRGEGAPGE